MKARLYFFIYRLCLSFVLRNAKLLTDTHIMVVIDGKRFQVGVKTRGTPEYESSNFCALWNQFYFTFKNLDYSLGIIGAPLLDHPDGPCDCHEKAWAARTRKIQSFTDVQQELKDGTYQTGRPDLFERSKVPFSEQAYRTFPATNQCSGLDGYKDSEEDGGGEDGESAGKVPTKS